MYLDRMHLQMCLQLNRMHDACVRDTSKFVFARMVLKDMSVRKELHLKMHLKGRI